MWERFHGEWLRSSECGDDGFREARLGMGWVLGGIGEERVGEERTESREGEGRGPREVIAGLRKDPRRRGVW